MKKQTPLLSCMLISTVLAIANLNGANDWRINNGASTETPAHFYDATTDYCGSTSNFPWEDWVARVKFGSIDNASGKSPYSDFTNLSTNLGTGSIPVELTTGFSYFTWDEYWRIWIDLNHDGDFSDAGETVFEGIKPKPANGSPSATLNGNLTIPASALDGPTRMRVSMKRNSFAMPCETLPFGEVEDYSVNISSGPSQLPDLSGLTIEVIPGNGGTCFTNPGQPFLVFYGLVFNFGTVPAGPFSMKGWFSKDQQLSADDVLWQSFQYTGAVPNNPVDFSFSNPVPANLPPGLYNVILKVDVDNTVAESDETDNIWIQSGLWIGAPDFTIGNVNGLPSTIPPGSNLNVAVQAKNLSAFPLAEISGSLTAKIYLSANNQFSPSEDVQLGTVQMAYNQFSNPPQYLNGTAWANVIVAIPGGIAAGDYYIFVELIGSCEKSTANNLTNPIPIQLMATPVCGFSKTYVEGNAFNGIYAEQTTNGFKIIGAKPLVPSGTTFLNMNTNQDGVFTGSTTENISAPMSHAPFRLKDGNYLFLSTTSDQKIKLEKRTAGGTVIWSRNYILVNTEVMNPVNLVEGNNGNIFITGTLDDSPAGAFFKLFVLKVNNEGLYQWSSTHSLQANPGNFNVKGLAATQDGGLIVYVTPSNVDNYIARIADYGNLVWYTMIAPTPLNVVKNAVEGTDGSILVSYTSDAPTGPTPVNVNFAKLTSTGVVDWSKNQTSIFGSIPNPVFIDFAQPFVAAAPGGNFAVVFTGVGGLYIAGLSSTGTTSWTKFHAFTPGISFFARSSDGGYLLAGSMNNQLWLMKTDNLGAFCNTPPPPPDYCDSQSNAPWHDWIARVKLNTLDNQSGKSVYSEFTNLGTSLQKGQSYPITLTTGFSWETFNEYWRVWIDWNHDNVFSTPDELVQQQILTAPAFGTPTASISGSVNVPQGALIGPARMRVSMKRGAYASACENFTYGEVEDYMVTIVNSLTGNGSERASGLAFEAVARATGVDMFGAYHQPDGVAEVVFEKSTDGENYFPLEIQPGEFTDAVEATDKEPIEGVNYYRLALHLTNGGLKVGPVRAIFFKPIPDFTILPNPATEMAYLNAEKLLGKSLRVSLHNAQGVLVKNIMLDKLEVPMVELPLNGLPSGIYMVYLTTPGSRPQGKILVVER